MDLRDDNFSCSQNRLSLISRGLDSPPPHPDLKVYNKIAELMFCMPIWS